MLLDEKSFFSTIDAAFQQQLAVVFEPQWKYLAPYISPSSLPSAGNEIPVIDLLQQWRERMHPTFGDLAEILCNLYIQPPLPSPPISQLPTELLTGTDQNGTIILCTLYLCIYVSDVFVGENSGKVIFS